MRQKSTSTNQTAPVAIITGASSGIGWETAFAFARRGYRLALAARSEDKLNTVAEKCNESAGEAIIHVTDVSRESDVEGLIQTTVERFGRIDVLINNAGYGIHARIHETQTQQMRDIMETNFFGVFFGCKHAAPIMIRQKSGHIFNVSSVIGKRGSPFNGGYCASKFAVCGLTDCLRVEMMPFNVHVTSVCPGLTKTEFFDNVDGESQIKKTSYGAIRGMMDPRIVAERIAATVGKNKPELVFSTGGKILTLLATISPKLTDRIMKVYHDDMARGTE